MKFHENTHKDLIAVKQLVYDPCDFKCSAPIADAESTEYGAYTFNLNDLNLRFRVAKITPTKTGQFVTLWKRSAEGITQPYDANDSIDFFIICVRNTDCFGQFVFPKSILVEENVFSLNKKGGKRGIRVYSPWDKATSKQAHKTQEWQTKYFLEIPDDKSVDYSRAKQLLFNALKIYK